MRWNEAIKVSIGMKQEPGVREKTARQCQKYLLGELKTDNGTVVYPGGGHDLHNPIGFTGQKHYIFISYLSIYLDGDDGPEWQVVYKYMEKFASKAKENCNIIWMGKPALAKPRPGHPRILDKGIYEYKFSGRLWGVKKEQGEINVTYHIIKYKDAYRFDILRGREVDILFSKLSWLNEDENFAYFLEAIKKDGYYVGDIDLTVKKSYGVPYCDLIGFKEVSNKTNKKLFRDREQTGIGYFDKGSGEKVYVYKKTKQLSYKALVSTMKMKAKLYHGKV